MRFHTLFASRIVRAPEDDAGFEFDEDFGDVQEVDELPDPDSDDGDEVGGDEADGDEDHLGELSPGEDQGLQDRSSEVRKTSRAQARVEAAIREAREAKEELARLRAERQQVDFQRQQRETEAQERERLALMDPEDRTQYLLQRQEQKFEQRLQAIQFQAEDRADKSAFESLAARNPVAAKLADKVEEYLVTMRRNGTTAPRETVLKYLIGENAIANAGRAKGKATRTAALNKARQAGRPTGGRGDVGPSTSRGGSEQAKRAARLADMEI